MKKGRLWNCSIQKESEETASQMQSDLDSFLYWIGRKATKDIRIIDRIGIWTDESTYRY